MSSHYVHYRNSARAVWRGWAQEAWRTASGGVCVMQALMDSLGVKETFSLPASMEEEIHEVLRWSPGYQRCLLASKGNIQVALVQWNDAKKRRKTHVVFVLVVLALKHRSEWRVEQRPHRAAAREQLEVEPTSSRNDVHELELAA